MTRAAQNEKPIEPPRNFNMTMFTVAGTPLPLADTEKLSYSAHNARFSMRIGGRRLIDSLRYFSASGKLFLTNFRLIYIPDSPSSSFSSFFLPISHAIVLDVRRHRVVLGVLLENGGSEKLKLRIRGYSTEAFVDQIDTLARQFAGIFAE
jgi:hypothetical protein